MENKAQTCIIPSESVKKREISTKAQFLNPKMIRISSTRGMLSCLRSPLNSSMAFFHSGETHLGNRTRAVGNAEDALKVFDEMLHSRPLPSVVRFTRILGQLVKLKQFEAVLSLNSQMGLVGIASDVYTLNITINCYCHLNHMEYALSVLAHFFKLGLQPTVATFTTLIHGFVLRNRMADAARVFSKMVEGSYCQPDVITFTTLIQGFCMIGNSTAAIQLLRKMEEHGCKPDVYTFSTIIDSQRYTS